MKKVKQSLLYGCLLAALAVVPLIVLSTDQPADQFSDNGVKTQTAYYYYRYNHGGYRYQYYYYPREHRYYYHWWYR